MTIRNLKHFDNANACEYFILRFGGFLISIEVTQGGSVLSVSINLTSLIFATN